MANIGQEPFAEPGVNTQRHDEAQLCASDLAQRLRMPAGRVHDQQAARSGELAKPLKALADQRHLGRVAWLGTHVQRHPVGARGLQRADLPLDPVALRPAVSHERRALIRAAHPQRRQIDMQAPRVDPEPLYRPRGDRAPQRLRVHRQDLKPPPEPVIVEQRRRDPEQFLQRRPRRPPGDVIQRRGRAQPTTDQRRDRLTHRQLLTPALGQRPVDRADQIQLTDEVPRQQQRPDLAAHPRHRRIQPRERSHQLLQLARRLELVLAPERLQHPVTHPPLLVTIRLHQPQIHVAIAPPDHRMPLDVHVGPTVASSPDGQTQTFEPSSTDPRRTNHPACWPYNPDYPTRTNPPTPAHNASNHRAARPTRQPRDQPPTSALREKGLADL